MEHQKILTFIDSPDIREYYKDLTLSPIQQAILVSWSRNRNMMEKEDEFPEYQESLPFKRIGAADFFTITEKEEP